MSIHPTAIVDKKARLADDVKVGPYAIIGPNVEIGKSTEIGAHAVVDGYTTIGEGCRIFTGVCVGTAPQDLKYKGEKSFLKIGNNNIIREYVTMNPGTDEGGVTSVGDGNLLMAYSHVAHDCKIGNSCVIANTGTLAGHVSLEDKVIIGGLAAIHQFVRIGKLSIIGGCSKIVKDIPPFSMCDGHPAKVYGLNLIGLKRAGITKEAISLLNKAFKILFYSGLSVRNALDNTREAVESCAEVEYLLDFVKASERGVCRGGE
ncbi:MAG: acyl-ACP--UDP-N-acetylglucosamine O-acyltransferase [Candidatus Omnitrophica bacterium]|nr:acyl-ACP--UDP-N-acetylglucosamine O-acyltransferase [Candidatus Omnitrophota bacterium]MBU4458046.1 acyl-ACP--UDP-N-acetylglucosamine O-acyltransferase [Candidatus Omnitrophota bacterium]